MKRSEMLLHIVDILNNSPRSVVNSYIADCILTGIEDIGMLPPINNHSFHMDGDKADENNIIYRTWESEE